MDICIEDMTSLLNNASVAAFVGAFSAYFLVAMTDWRRRRKRRDLLARRISVNRDLARAKRETANNNISLIRGNRFSAAPVMPFPTEDIRTLQREALDVLSAAEINALDALVYWMEAIDGIFDRAQRAAEEIESMAKANADTAARNEKGRELLHEFTQAEKNLGHLFAMAKFYIDGNPEKFLEFKHTVE